MLVSAGRGVCAATGGGRAGRAEKLGRDVEGRRRDGLAGSPAEVVDKLGQFAAAGATRAYLQIMDLADLDHLELIAAERGNIVSVEHHREGMAIDVVETEVSLTVITRDEAHCGGLTAALESRGYSVDRVS